MASHGLAELLKKQPALHFEKGQLVYSLDFKEQLYVVISGYIKRFSVTSENKRLVQVMYGPGSFFPLSTVYKKLLAYDLSEDNVSYFYEAVSDVEIHCISIKQFAAEIKKNPELYADLLYEAGRRLRSNISHFENYSLHGNLKKTAHLLVFFAEEFGMLESESVRKGVQILLPLKAEDIAEHINSEASAVKTSLAKLESLGIIETKDDSIFILDLNLLKDTYLSAP